MPFYENVKNDKNQFRCVCDLCEKQFWRNQNRKSCMIIQGYKKCFCSYKCAGIDRTKNGKHICKCTNCNSQFLKSLNQIKKTKNHFCSRSCAVTYNNTHKTKGTRVSKLELWLKQQLTLLYPNLQIHYNRKDAINSELDIYIPSLKLAFQLNGIFHYEPIYGIDKLSKIQNNDNRKFQACIENGIQLCIIDTSKFMHFKKQKAQAFLNIIQNILIIKLSMT